MKKTNLIIALATVGLLASCGGGASSSSEAHVHTYADDWSCDASGHWHAPTCGDTTDVADYAEHTFGDDRVCTVCGYVEATKVDMTWDQALALIGSDNAIAHDSDVGSYVEDYSVERNWNEAIYMSLSVTDSDGNSINVATYDDWSEMHDVEAVTADKVFDENTTYWGGDGTTDPSRSDDAKTSDTHYQAYYYDEDDIVVMTKDNDTGASGLTAVYGQAYSDWWDMTYGKYSSAYIGMQALSGFDESYFGQTLGKNGDSSYNLDYYKTYYDSYEPEEGEDPIDYSGYVTTSVEAWSDYTTVSVSVKEDEGSLFAFLGYTDEEGNPSNGYAAATDAELTGTFTLIVTFDTVTGVVSKYEYKELYTIETNPNTGRDLMLPYICGQSDEVYYNFGLKEATFTGDKIEMSDADKALYSYYGIWYRSSDVYWFITITQGYAGTYLVDHTKFVKKVSQVFIDGFTNTAAPVFEDGSVKFTGAKSFAVTDADGNPVTDESGTAVKTKYDYVLTVNADGNLEVVGTSQYDNSASEYGGTFLSAANWAAANAAE